MDNQPEEIVATLSSTINNQKNDKIDEKNNNTNANNNNTNNNNNEEEEDPSNQKNVLEEDEHEIQWCTEEEALNALNMRKFRRGEEQSPYDINKLYDYMLEQDLMKVKELNKFYEEPLENIEQKYTKNSIQYKKYMERLKRVKVSKEYLPTTLGLDGNFNEVFSLTIEKAWKESSQPYGAMAHKRYLEYLSHIPEPQGYEILKEITQRKHDLKLWQDLKFGEYELREWKKPVEEENMIDREKRLYKEKLLNREKYFRENNFIDMRDPPTYNQFQLSLKDWNKGIYQYNSENISKHHQHPLLPIHYYKTHTPAIKIKENENQNDANNISSSKDDEINKKNNKNHDEFSPYFLTPYVENIIDKDVFLLDKEKQNLRSENFDSKLIMNALPSRMIGSNKNYSLYLASENLIKTQNFLRNYFYKLEKLEEKEKSRQRELLRQERIKNLKMIKDTSQKKKEEENIIKKDEKSVKFNLKNSTIVPELNLNDINENVAKTMEKNDEKENLETKDTIESGPDPLLIPKKNVRIRERRRGVGLIDMADDVQKAKIAHMEKEMAFTGKLINNEEKLLEENKKIIEKDEENESDSEDEEFEELKYESEIENINNLYNNNIILKNYKIFNVKFNRKYKKFKKKINFFTNGKKKKFYYITNTEKKKAKLLLLLNNLKNTLKDDKDILDTINNINYSIDLSCKEIQYNYKKKKKFLEGKIAEIDNYLLKNTSSYNRNMILEQDTTIMNVNPLENSEQTDKNKKKIDKKQNLLEKKEETYYNGTIPVSKYRNEIKRKLLYETRLKKLEEFYSLWSLQYEGLQIVHKGLLNFIKKKEKQVNNEMENTRSEKIIKSLINFFYQVDPLNFNNKNIVVEKILPPIPTEYSNEVNEETDNDSDEDEETKRKKEKKKKKLTEKKIESKLSKYSEFDDDSDESDEETEKKKEYLSFKINLNSKSSSNSTSNNNTNYSEEILDILYDLNLSSYFVNTKQPYVKDVIKLLKKYDKEKELNSNFIFSYLFKSNFSLYNDKTSSTSLYQPGSHLWRIQRVNQLIFAASSGDYKGLLQLLDNREILRSDRAKYWVGPNEVNEEGMTPLFATVLLLIENKVLNDYQNVEKLFYSKKILFLKKCMNIINIKKFFSSKSNPDSKNKVEFDKVIKILLFFGAKLNFSIRDQETHDGLTLLHYSIKKNNLTVLKWLLNMGESSNQLTSIYNRTPLMLAAKYNNLDAFMLLLQYGAMVSVMHSDSEGNTLLHYAAKYSDPLIVKVALLCGSNRNIHNNNGKLPIDETVNRQEIREVLITFKQNIPDELFRLHFLYAYHNIRNENYEGGNIDEDNIFANINEAERAREAQAQVMLSHSQSVEHPAPSSNNNINSLSENINNVIQDVQSQREKRLEKIRKDEEFNRQLQLEKEKIIEQNKLIEQSSSDYTLRVARKTLLLNNNKRVQPKSLIEEEDDDDEEEEREEVQQNVEQNDELHKNSRKSSVISLNMVPPSDPIAHIAMNRASFRGTLPPIALLKKRKEEKLKMQTFNEEDEDEEENEEEDPSKKNKIRRQTVLKNPYEIQSRIRRETKIKKFTDNDIISSLPYVDNDDGAGSSKRRDSQFISKRRESQLAPKRRESQLVSKRRESQLVGKRRESQLVGKRRESQITKNNSRSTMLLRQQEAELFSLRRDDESSRYNTSSKSYLQNHQNLEHQNFAKNKTIENEKFKLLFKQNSKNTDQIKEEININEKNIPKVKDQFLDDDILLASNKPRNTVMQLQYLQKQGGIHNLRKKL